MSDDRLAYKDTQAFVGPDGKQKAPTLVPGNPFVTITPDAGRNQTQIGTKYGGGAFLKTGANLTDIDDPDAAANAIGVPQYIQASSIASEGGERGRQAHEAQYNHVDLNVKSVTDTGLDATAVVKTDANKKLATTVATGKAGDYLGGDLAFHSLPAEVTYYFADTADALGGLYKVMDTPQPGAATETYTITGADQAVQNWITPIAGVGFTSIDAGSYILHFHVQQTGGLANCFGYGKFYKRDGATETLIGQTGNTPLFTGTNIEVEVTADIGAPVTLNATDRIVLKMFMSRGLTGSNPVVAVFLGGINDSHIHLPALPPSGTGSTALMGPGIGIDGSSIVTNLDGGKQAIFGHEGVFNHQLLRFMDLPFFKADGSEQDVALNNIGNLPFFLAAGTEQDVQIVSPVSVTNNIITQPDLIQTQVFI